MTLEANKINETMPQGMRELLRDCGGYIAGGAVTSVFTGADINDLDIYFETEQGFRAFLLKAVESRGDYLDAFELKIGGLTDKCVFGEVGEQKVQLIYGVGFMPPEELFSKFDFTVCMGAFHFKDRLGFGEFQLSGDFLKHCSQRYLCYNPETNYPLVSLLRVQKYREKGYNISIPDMLCVGLSCSEIRLNNWESARAAIGGMYGLDMSTFFDETLPCNTKNVILQLKTRSGREMKPHEYNLSVVDELREKFNLNDERAIQEWLNERYEAFCAN